MIQNFKTLLYAAYLQPGRTPMAIGTIFLLIACVKLDWLLYAIAITILLATAVWQKVMLIPINECFAVLPSVPILDGRPYYYLCQRPRRDAKGMSCHELRRLLIADKRTLNEVLPKGNYQTVTHGAVLRIFDKCERVHVEGVPKPIYKNSMHRNLLRLTGGRCKRCESRCAAWNSTARVFYYVRFTVS